MSDLSQRLAALSPEKRALLEAQLKQRGQAYNTFPLSYVQQRLWLFDQLQPGDTSYNLVLAFRLRGALDASALERSVNTIVERHEVLRTIYPTVRGQPVQSVMPFAPFGLPRIQLEAGADRLLAVQALLENESQHVFDLEHGPLFRCTLVGVDATEHILICNMHHICSDGWSLSILTRELSLLYAAYAAGQPSPLAPLPIQYADYAVWLRDPASVAEQEQHLSYWRERLRDAPPFLELPTDFARPPVQTSRSITHSTTLPLPLVERLRALGQSEHATLFMTSLAIFQTLLARLADQTDIVIGTPIANRARTETEGMIGFFVNTLVFRNNLAATPTFRALLAQVRDTALEAYAHQDISFDRLLEELNPARNLSHTPLFQVFFNMTNTPALAMQWGDMQAEIITPQETGSKFDLTLYLQEDATGLRLDVVAKADLFLPERLVEFLQQYRLLAEQIVEQPDAVIDSYSLVTPTARAVLPDPRAPLSDRWEGAIHELLSQQATQHPERIALEDPTERWSYGELERRANQLAHWLVAQGIGPGDVVAIAAHRSAALVWAMMGIFKSGAAYVMLDPAYPVARLQDYLAQTQPRALIVLKPSADTLSALIAHFAATYGRPTIVLPTLAEAEAQQFLAAYLTQPPAVTCGPDTIAAISFTSGSTGRPKGIMQRHGPLTHFLPWQRATFGLAEDDRFTMLSGLSHDPVQRDIFTPLAQGACLVIPDPEQMGMPGYLATWMRDHAVTVTNLTSAMIQLVTQVPPSDPPFTLPLLRRAFIVGDALRRHDVARLWALAPHLVCVNYFGSTETQRALSYYVIPPSTREGTGPLPKEIVPIGKGSGDMQLLLVNAQHYQAGIGEVGEILVRSPHLAQGYLDDPELTRARFIANPLTGMASDRVYRTGDLGRYLPDGTVEYLARHDQQVKIRGFRIELGEIEAVLRTHPSVRDAVVLPQELPQQGMVLIAYVQLINPPLTAAIQHDLRQHMQSQLPQYMVPSQMISISAIPLSPNGKLDRRALPKAEERMATDQMVAPHTPREVQLVQIWQEVLGLAAVSVDANFFDIGGHSLLATQMVARILEETGKVISLRQLFEAPTITELAALLDDPNRVTTPLQTPTPLTRLARQ
jgi:amino acid adenylation domain-containing protein